MQKRNDYNRHKLLRKIKKQREAEKEQQAHIAEKELKRKLRKPRYDDGKDSENINPVIYPTLIDRDYDLARAQQLGYVQGENGHLPSRDYVTGDILKSPSHPTFLPALLDDAAMGYYPTKDHKPGRSRTDTWKGNAEFIERQSVQTPKYWPGKDAAKTAWEIAGYLPYIGTLKDGIELAKDPSWSNAGRFATSLAFDALGGGLIASGSKIVRRAAMERMAREAVGHATYGYGTAAAKQAAARSIDARNEMAMLSHIIDGMVNGAQEANTEGSKTRQYIQSVESRRNK